MHTFKFSQAGKDSYMLTIALEPEAAALYVKHLPVEKRVDGKKGECFQAFALGSKYIVVDAGGMFVYAICFNTQIWLWIR